MISQFRQLKPALKCLVIGSLALEILAILLYGIYSKSSTLSALSAATRSSLCQNAAQTLNPIEAENTCIGTTSWRPDHPVGSQHAIEAFTAPVSVNSSESINIYVSTTASFYSLRIYRMGWYQGLGGRLVYSAPRLSGIVQPPPLIDPATRMASASNWHDPVTLAIPASWVSGVYVVKLVSSTGYLRYTSFVVRNDSRNSQILFQSSVLTYQAYNTWGGGSLYGSAAAAYDFTQRSYAVSFDRPYPSSNAGLSYSLDFELPLLWWLERKGYNMTYTTDIDTDLRGQLLLNHHLFLAAGHDEYWSTAMRQNITRARDGGTSLAFFGADDGYWHVRLQASPLGPDRVVVCYKDAALDPIAAQNPESATVGWRDPPLFQPENDLLGAMYAGTLRGPAPLVLTAGAAAFFQGTRLHVGIAIPGLVGADFGPAYPYGSSNTGEFDSVYGDGRRVQMIASSPVHVLQGEDSAPPGTYLFAAATLYTAPSGAKVFDAGTFWWGLGLDDLRLNASDPAGGFSSADFQQFTVNLLGYLLQR